MNSPAPSDDDSDGDLGLGDGLKPGALPNIPVTESCRPGCIESEVLSTSTSDRQNREYKNFAPLRCLESDDETDSDSENLSDFEISLLAIKPVLELKDQYRSKEPSQRSTETFPVEKKSFGNCLLDCDLKEKDGKEFPIFADVQYGTSIRQQKELFNQNIEDLKKKHSVGKDINLSGSSSRSSILSDSGSTCKHGQSHLTSEEIAMELAKRLQEVEELKNELETCESRLDAKYKAIDILRKQAEEAQVQLKASEKMSRETAVKLAQVCYTGEGGGGVSYSELVDQDLGTMPPTGLIKQHTHPAKEKENIKKVPKGKYNRVCKENASLLSRLETKTEELRKITAQKMAVERENDELLALLDIQERTKYEKTKSVSSEEEYCTFNSTELAILGACRCRIISPNPCGCAHAAANLKKEVVRYKEEILQYKNRRDEAFLTVDAYRKAFEEQLERSKALTLQLANLTTSAASKTSKARQALKWLMGTMNDDDIDSDSDSQTSSGPVMSEHEFITYLVEMLHEKKEVLAHQKLMSQILGDRLKTAEEKLLKYEAKDEVFS